MSADAADAYVTDVGYTAGFYREMAPAHLAFAAVIAGFSPGRALHPRRVLELGFGQGFGLAVLAAANPDVAFEGCDFNPEHVEHARQLAERAGLSNLNVFHAAFETAAAEGEQDVDIITMHGVLSWVSRQTQEALVAILRRRLRPGGLLYVSYNALPGWAPVAPIQDFIVEVKRRCAGTSQQRLVLALDLLGALRRGNSHFFAANPRAAEHFDRMLTMDGRYLAHEYLGEHWKPLGFCDVAKRLNPAGLAFVGTATLSESLDECTLPRGALPLLQRIEDPMLRETIRDVATNKLFRRDIYARDAVAISSAQRRDLLARFNFTLIVPRDAVSFRFFTPLGKLDGKQDLYAPIVDRLAEDTAGFEELLSLRWFAGRIGVLIECLTLLVHSGQVLPVVSPAVAHDDQARRFNRVIVELARDGIVYDHLASPVTRTGIPVSDFGLLALAALRDGRADSPDLAARHGLAILSRLGRRPSKDGEPIGCDDDAVAFLAGHMKPFLDQSVAVWQRLKMI